MAEELLYTSAPQGLRPGSAGFCTVQASAGMPAPILQGLESLSAYRHPLPAGDPKNPVAWSHVRLNIGGKSLSVISRVADAGLDFTQRSNKLAHHLVLAPTERPIGGPAWLLAQPGFLKDRWDGTVKERTQKRDVPRGDRPPGLCRTWQKVTGDAGWAGVLAEAFLADPNHQACIRFDFGMPVLELLQEAVALLPASKRWDVTFSTYATTLPPTATCHWRCLLNDSKEAHEARRLARALQWNLSAMGPLTQTGPLIEAARTGVMPEEETVLTPPPPTEPAPRRAASKRTSGERVDEEAADAIHGVLDDEEVSVPFSVEKNASAPPGLPPRARTSSSGQRTADKASLMPWIGAGLTGFAVLCAIMIFVFTRPPGEKPAEIVQNQNADNPQPIPDPAPTEGKGSRKLEPVKLNSTDGDTKVAANPGATDPPQMAATDVPKPVGPNPPPSDPAPPAEKVPATVPPTEVKPPTPAAPKVSVAEAVYLDDKALDKPIEFTVPEHLLTSAKSSALTMQMFAPGKLTEESAFAEGAFNAAEDHLTIKWNSTAGANAVATWAISREEDRPQVSFKWDRNSEEAKRRLRLCALLLSNPDHKVAIRPRPLLKSIDLKPNLQWKQVRFAEPEMVEELKQIAELGLSFVVHEASFATEPPIHFQRNSPAGSSPSNPPFTRFQVEGSVTSAGELKLDIVSEPSEKEQKDQVEKLEFKLKTAKTQPDYEPAFSVPQSQVRLDGAALPVLAMKLDELKAALEKAAKLDKDKKAKALAAIEAIRRDIVTPYNDAQKILDGLKKTALDKAKLTRLSFGYEIQVPGLAEPVFVELVHLDDTGKAN